MNLYKDDVLEIDLKSDILWVCWKERATLEDFKPVADLIADFSNKILAESMLIDASTTMFKKDAPDAGIMNYFVKAISGTPVKKIARIMSENAIFESKVLYQKLRYDVSVQLPFEYQFFSDEAKAIAWLQA